MKTITPAALFLIAAASAAIGGVTSHLLGPRVEPGVTSAGSLPLEPSTNASVDLAGVEAATLELERRLGALELAQHSGARTDAAPAETLDAAARLTALEERLAALEALREAGGPLRPLPLAVNEEMKLQVAEALEEVRMDEAVAKVTTRQEKEAEALNARLDKYQDALGLSEGQVSDLRGMFEERQRRERELVQLWRDGADDATMAAEKQGLQEDLSQQLGEVLSPQQVEDFYELQRGGSGK